jgi:hypothetical protein
MTLATSRWSLTRQRRSTGFAISLDCRLAGFVDRFEERPGINKIGVRACGTPGKLVIVDLKRAHWNEESRNRGTKGVGNLLDDVEPNTVGVPSLDARNCRSGDA